MHWCLTTIVWKNTLANKFWLHYNHHSYPYSILQFPYVHNYAEDPFPASKFLIFMNVFRKWFLSSTHGSKMYEYHFHHHSFLSFVTEKKLRKLWREEAPLLNFLNGMAVTVIFFNFSEKKEALQKGNFNFSYHGKKSRQQFRQLVTFKFVGLLKMCATAAQGY